MADVAQEPETQKSNGTSTRSLAMATPNPAPHFGRYQNEIYQQGMFLNQVPSVTCDTSKLEEQAREQLPATAFSYVAGGAGAKATMAANRLAFQQWKLVPRMLTDLSDRDVSVELFGERYASPVLIAPLGVQSIFHEDREVGVARVAAELGVPFIMSTAATSTIEEVAEANGTGPRWFQLYWPRTDELTISLLSRARKAGFTVLVVTLDTFSLGWRPSDLDLGYLPFLKGTGNQVPMSDPYFRKRFKDRTGKEVEEDVAAAYGDWASDTFSGLGHSWEDLKVLKENWDGPIVLKGIQSQADALKAVEWGMDGIIVSNHGGRQVDGAIASLDVLPEIVDAVGNKITVLFDSGIRTGSDIVKALCLGAKAVLVGRPWVYGLSIGGAAGAKHVLRCLLSDFDQNMMLSGISSTKNCNRSMLRKVAYVGDANPSY